jgi:hypothetical protein
VVKNLLVAETVMKMIGEEAMNKLKALLTSGEIGKLNEAADYFEELKKAGQMFNIETLKNLNPAEFQQEIVKQINLITAEMLRKNLKEVKTENKEIQEVKKLAEDPALTPEMKKYIDEQIQQKVAEELAKISTVEASAEKPATLPELEKEEVKPETKPKEAKRRKKPAKAEKKEVKPRKEKAARKKAKPKKEKVAKSEKREVKRRKKPTKAKKRRLSARQKMLRTFMGPRAER